MARSQNGWPAFTSGTHPDLVAIEEIAGRVRRDPVAVIFRHFNYRFHREVEPITEAAGQPQDDWGFASRPIRGGVATSNHASGTAEDLNAPKHPLGAVGTFSSTQRIALRKLLNEFGGVIRWGGDYSGRKDEMHFEILPGPDSPAVQALADLIISHGGPGSIHGGPVVPTNPTPKPGGSLAPAFPLRAGYYFGPRFPESNAQSVSGWYQRRSNGQRGHDGLAAWQQRMKDRGWKITVDGIYGDQTGDVAEKFQREKGLVPDRLIGPATWAFAWTSPVT